MPLVMEMDLASLTNLITMAAPLTFHHRSKPYFLQPLLFARRARIKFNLIPSRFQCRFPLCSFPVSVHDKGRASTCGGSEGVEGVSVNKLLQVVLVSPQIPGNTGAIARTCAASAVGLHLVEPLGFPVDNSKLKRAGLDYWPYVVVKVHHSWTDFRDYYCSQAGEKRLLAFTKGGTKTHSDFEYRYGDWLVFGAETSGLPPEVLLDCKNEASGDTLRIPMVDAYVRSLNLSVSVGIGVYEALRQLKYEQLELEHAHAHAHGSVMRDERLCFTEDIFA